MSSHTLYPALDRCYRLARYALQETTLEDAVWAGQDRVLCALRPDAPTLQSELSRSLCMNEKALHRSIQYLRKLYYVRSEEAGSDMRANLLYLTGTGTLMVDHMRWAYSVVAKEICVGLSPDEVTELERLLAVAVMREGALRDKFRLRRLAEARANKG